MTMRGAAGVFVSGSQIEIVAGGNISLSAQVEYNHYTESLFVMYKSWNVYLHYLIHFPLYIVHFQ